MFIDKEKRDPIAEVVGFGHSVRSATSVESKPEIEEASAKRLRITTGSLVDSACYEQCIPDGVREISCS